MTEPIPEFLTADCPTAAVHSGSPACVVMQLMPDPKAPAFSAGPRPQPRLSRLLSAAAATACLLLLALTLCLLPAQTAFAQNGPPPEPPGSPSEGAGRAFDEAGNYSNDSSASNFWNNGSNEGFGFGPWAINTGIEDGGFAGAFLGDPAVAEIIGMENPSFGLFANPAGGNFVNADRTLTTPLEVGATFSFQWGNNWDSGGSGNKGFNLYVGGTGGTQVINVNQGNSANITINNQPMFAQFGTNPITFHFQRVSATQLRVTATGRDGNETYDNTFTLTSSAIDAFRFYASGLVAGDERQPYFNNLEVSFPFVNPPQVSARDIVFSNITNTSMRLRWTSGDGDRRLVIAREGSPVNFTPVSGTEYPANADFSASADLGDGNKAVYAGDDDTFTITGLQGDTRYYFRIFEFNVDDDDPTDSSVWAYRTFAPAEGDELTLDSSNIFITRDSGDWDDTDTWESGTLPTEGGNVVILDEHTVTLNVDSERLGSFRINSGGALVLDATNTLNMRCGGDFTVESSGTFTGGDGTVDFLRTEAGTGISIISGTVPFSNVRVGADEERTCGVDFGTASELNGELRINIRGFVEERPPAYQPNSTLFYNTGGTFNRGAEWPPFDEGSGNSPFNVQINAQLNMAGHTTPRAARGNLQIDAGRTLTLSAAVGGDLLVGGNWTNEGTFNANFRAVTFNGTQDQVVTNDQSGGISIDFLRNENTSEGLGLVFRNDVSVLDFRNEGKLSFNSGNGGPFTFTLIRDTRSENAVSARFTNNYDEGTIDLSNAVLTFDAEGQPDPVLFFTAAEDSRLIFGGVNFQLGNALVKDGPGELVLQGEANTSLFIDAGLLRLEDGFSFDTPASRNIDLGTAIEAGGRHTARAELVLASGTYTMNSVRVRSLNASSGDRILRFVSDDAEAPATLDAALDLEKLLFVRVEADHYGALNGPVTGAQSFVKQETGSLSLATATFGPGLFIDEGRVRLEAFPLTGTQTIALGTSEDLPIVASDATLEIRDLDTVDFTIARPVEIRGGQTNNPNPGAREIVFATSDDITATLSSGISLPTTLDVTVIEEASGAISGIVSGSSGLNKRGAGQLDLSGNNTFTGTVQLFGGTLRLGGDGLPGTNPIQVRGDVGIASTGSGSTGARTIANNVEFFNAGLRLGQETGGTGTLTFTGSFELGGAERFINTPGGTHNISGNIVNGQLRKEGAGQLNLSGVNTVSATTINAGTLRLNRSSGSTITLGGTITINDGGILDYSTGDGSNNQLANDTQIIVNGTDAANRGHFFIGPRADIIGSLTLEGGLYSKGGGALTINGAANLNSGFVTFSAGSGNTIVGQSLVIGNIFAQYTGAGENAQVILELSPDFGGTITQLADTGSVFENNRSTATAIPTINLGGNSVTFQSQSNSNTTLNFAISNGSLTKAGPGTLLLNEASTFAGGISINEGTVGVTNNEALGTGDVTLNGGTLRADANVSVANKMVLIGNDSSIDVTENSSAPFILSHTGEMSGSGDLTKTGPGTLTLGDNATFTGATAVHDGTLLVNNGFASTDLSINDGGTLTFGSTAPTARSLTLSGLEIESGGILNLSRDDDELIIPASLPVTIPATATVNTSGTGARLTLQSGAVYRNLSSSTPTLHVERAFAGDNTNSDRQGWRMLASPVETSYADMFETDADPSTFVTQGFTGSTYSNRQFNLLWWDETDSTGTTLQRWRMPEGASETIPAGRGHFFYIFDGAPLLNPGSGEPTNYTDNLPLTMSATGTEPDLSAGPFDFGVTFSLSDTVTVGGTFIGALVQDQGWNLVGNPTASWLDWTAVDGAWTKTELSNVIYVWNPEENDYVFTNSITGTHEGYIAPFQAFWVQAVAQDPVLSFGNDAKTVAPNTNSGFVGRPVMSAAGPGASDFHGVSPNNTETSDGPDAGGGATVLPLRLRVAEGGAARTAEKFVMLSERGQFGADRWDAYRLQPMSDSWLTLASAMAPGSAPMVINSLPPASEIGGPLNLPLYVGGATAGQPLAGQFTLEWELPADWDPDLSLVLMDHELQRAIPMRGTQRSYSFSHATDPGMLGLMVSPSPGDGSGFGGPAQIGTPSPAPARGAATGRTAQASVASSGTGSALASTSASTSTSASASLPLLPATLLGGTHLPADWSPDFTATAALLPEGLATAPARPDDAHIPYIPLAVAAEDSGSGSGTGTALGRSLPAGSGGAVPEARFSIFMQPLSGGPGADETIPYTPIGISLAQNYPNPFNPATTVRFSLPEEAEIRLEVFDLLGRRIALLAADRFPAGTHTLRWDATGQATGLYLLRLSAPETGTVQTRKMMLVR